MLDIGVNYGSLALGAALIDGRFGQAANSHAYNVSSSADIVLNLRWVSPMACWSMARLACPVVPGHADQVTRRRRRRTTTAFGDEDYRASLDLVAGAAGTKVWAYQGTRARPQAPVRREHELGNVPPQSSSSCRSSDWLPPALETRAYPRVISPTPSAS